MSASRSKDGLFKRGDVWWCWASKYPGGPKERISTRSKDRGTARIVAARIAREAADPAHYAAHETTVADGIRLLMDESAEAGRAAATLSLYEQKTAHLARLLGQATPLRTLNHGDVRAYIRKRESEGAAKSTVKKELVRLGQILKKSKQRGMFVGDVGAIMPTYSPAYVPRQTFLTLEQAEKLVAEVEKEGARAPHRAAQIAFVVATGARLGEMERACREDIDEANHFVSLRGTKTTASKRVVPVPPIFDGLLQVALKHGAKTSVLFKPWDSARRDIFAMCVRAGVPPVTWNDLRRSFASILRQRGVPNADIAKLLGHTTTQMVDRVYGQMPPEALAEALARSLGRRTIATQPKGSRSE